MHLEHRMDDLPTPVRHTAHGNLPESCRISSPSPEAMNFVLVMFTWRPLDSNPSFHALTRSTHSSREVAMITRSSAKNSSQGTPTLKSLDKASSTMIKSSGLYYTFIYPYLNYCVHLWGSTYDNYVNKILCCRNNTSHYSWDQPRGPQWTTFSPLCVILLAMYTRIVLDFLCKNTTMDYWQIYLTDSKKKTRIFVSMIHVNHTYYMCHVFELEWGNVLRHKQT